MSDKHSPSPASDELITLSTASEHRDLTLEMAQQAQRYVYIFTRDLDQAVYNNEPLVEALSALARGSQHAHVHILVQDSTPAVKAGHRLVALAQRLSSKVKIQLPSKEYADFNEAFLIADEQAYIHRPIADRYEGSANHYYPLRARELARLFREMWEKSVPDPQLRRLHI